MALFCVEENVYIVGVHLPTATVSGGPGTLFYSPRDAKFLLIYFKTLNNFFWAGRVWVHWCTLMHQMPLKNKEKKLAEVQAT